MFKQRTKTIASLALVAVLWPAIVCAQDLKGKKVLFVDSYHEGYAWSDGITAGVKGALASKGVDLKVFRMDTKRNPSEEAKVAAATKAKAEIDAYKPDAVIVSDDNATKYVLANLYKDGTVPFVFCGVNWDAGVYGLPYKNATGMIEVTPVTQILDYLKKYAKGGRIGFIGPDLETPRKEAENIKKKFGLQLVEYYSKDKDDFKAGLAQLSSQTDMIIVDSDGGLYKESQKEIADFIEKNVKVPVGTSYDFMSSYALISFSKVAEEQGDWAAQAAIKIMQGKSASEIPVSENKEGVLIVNARIAKALGVEIPFEVISSAQKVIE